MKSLKYIPLFIFFLLLAGFPGYAQPAEKPSTDEQLAAQYYQAGEYEKALVYYERLFGKKPIALYYNYYLSCMLAVNDFKKAEKVVKRQVRNFPYDLSYQVDLGRVYRAAGEEEKSKKTFVEAINRRKRLWKPSTRCSPTRTR
ncbi:MAG: hypothetical protein FD123_2019 [Bacteroidetes bacterium]|nr:MAG: hypothetical protein FD123_2019 [Bacteroidota bacterium]